MHNPGKQCWQRVLFWGLMPFLMIGAFSSCAVDLQLGSEKDLSWPQATSQNHPWSRWWWLGNAVDKENLTSLLTAYRDTGLGGVEICPIYGVKGYEDQFLDFLSPQWMQMLNHTTREGERLGIGVDLTTGTGWPFGGKHVTNQTASMKVLLETYEVIGGITFLAQVPKDSKAKLEYLLAVSENGERIELTEKVQNKNLTWEAPAGQWTIYEVSTRSPIQRVKRAAPGGEGYVLDPYSVTALDAYLSDFDKAFMDFEGTVPRSHFHDSFEYYDATWTRDFFEQFQTLRGYDLREHIEALFGNGPEDTVARVKCDYRETISDLHLAYIQRWTQWCHRYGSLSRNQAHGSPGNLIDLYAAADIPETEIFRAVDERQYPMLKFSSSAAHLKGTALASSESFTWLREHFNASLADVKSATDFLFLSGINHIFFHGIPYSPQQADWPGWQFYASVNFGPDGGLWHALPAYNAYVTRCQSILQSGKPDQDALLYMPVYDFWHTEEGLPMPFRIHNQGDWLYATDFYDTAMSLWKKGYAYDAVSDRFLAEASVQDGKVILGDNTYSVIVVPQCRMMPAVTLKKLLQLARWGGATVLFQKSLPADVPGLGNLERRRTAFREILSQFGSGEPGHLQLQLWAGSTGKVMIGELEEMLRESGIRREEAVDAGIQYIRRTHPKGTHYFFVNRSDRPVNQWIPLARPARSALLMDPMDEDLTGTVALLQKDDSTQVYLQLDPGQSMILRTFTNKKVEGRPWQYVQFRGELSKIEGPWNVTFVEGGPNLPKAYQTKQLASWTERDDPEAKRFAGTARYTIEFEKPAQSAGEWILDLGKVCESARVRLNGQEVAALWSQPFQCRVGNYLRAGKNKLEIEVTNLAANRVRDLDERNVEWKKFYDINIVNIDYKPLDASKWPLRDSGLLGPVHLIPQAVFDPDR